ncbi:MAG: alpha/beta hydrolase [Candidatus Hydrogenedentes bacterium]|nr:alpha/beta hydrolase [Candidatus Hydrogenedentota bacterium]
MKSIVRPILHVTMATLILLLVPACATRQLMPPPALYAARGENPFEGTPEVLRSPDVNIIYATDRQRLEDKTGALTYGSLRAPALVTGVSAVRFGEIEDWDSLVSQSLSTDRKEKLAPHIVKNTETFTWPASGRKVDWYLSDEAGKRAIEAEFQVAGTQLQEVVSKQLSQTDLKEVYVLVHGYNVPFDDSVTTIAELWHFMGRQGVPIAYSWPAGHGGIRGYTTDRESGEYTVMHLKNMLEALAQCPDLQKVNILAHSRGTDVALTALRELNIAYRNRGLDPGKALKLGSVVLAAPDLDFEVVTQRVMAEGVPFVPEQVTIYISEDDRALGLSSWVFDSVSRIGKLTSKILSPVQKKRLAQNDTLEVVDARVKRADIFGHSYFYQDPSVSSDVILVLKEHRAAGAENGRPLALQDNFWVVNPGYPEFK